MATWMVGMMTKMVRFSFPILQKIGGGEVEDELTLGETFDLAIMAENVWPTDGAQGIKKLNRLAEMLGYNKTFQTPLETMLELTLGILVAESKMTSLNDLQPISGDWESTIAATPATNGVANEVPDA